jgi:hypothetical protein
LNGEISYAHRQLVYQFNINNDQSSSLNSGQSANLSGVCGLIYNADCECGFDNDCNCACQKVARPAVSFDTTIYSTTTTTPCPNQCWCGFSYNYINNCECNCSFAQSETPHIILTWDDILSDLDLYVVDPNGEEIYYSHQSSSSGGKFSRDSKGGPNAFEFISWGLIQDGIKGPIGNYKIYVKSLRISGRTQYNVAVLESPDQDWKYINGKVSYRQKTLIYEFNINNDRSSSLNSDQPVNFSGVCGLIFNADCECGFDNDCNCACELVTRPTVSYSFDTSSIIETTVTPYR